MNVLVLGDSWGCDFADPSQGYGPVTEGNFQPLTEISTAYTASSVTNIKQDGSPQNSWLRYSDHVIFNSAIWGGSNMDTLNAGKTFLQNRINNKNTQIDLIVWYYTELGRDQHNMGDEFPLLGSDKVEVTLDFLHTETNKLVSEIRTMSPNSKWAIIGGHASLYKPSDYDWADFIIKDLVSTLVGYHVPTSHFQGTHHYGKSDNDWEYSLFTKNIDVLENEISKLEHYLSVKEAHKVDIFTDGTHACSMLRHTLVTDKILNYFSPENA